MKVNAWKTLNEHEVYFDFPCNSFYLVNRNKVRKSVHLVSQVVRKPWFPRSWGSLGFPLGFPGREEWTGCVVSAEYTISVINAWSNHVMMISSTQI